MQDIPYDVYDRNCPARKALNRISDKWTALIVGQLEKRPHRFSELLTAIDGVSQKMLTQTLRKLERDGLVRREVDSTTVPITVTYSLTTVGLALTKPLASVRVWVEKYSSEITKAQRSYDRKAATKHQAHKKRFD